MRQLVASIFACTLFTLAPPVLAQTARCVENLDSLQHRITLDYAGYRLEVAGIRDAALRDTLSALKTVAAHTSDSDCYPLLDALVSWYHDPHLFVYQAPVVDSASSAGKGFGSRTVSESSARQYLDRNATHLDPIEGLWYDGVLRVAVLPANDGTAGHFEAVVLRPDTAGWNVDDVRATIARRTDGNYDVRLLAPNHALSQLTGEIRKRVMLRLSPGIWGKEYPLLAADRGLLNPDNAHRATLMARDGTVIVSIPSHDPTYQSTLDSLLASNETTLRRADRLIVDLRGNEGGSSGMTNGLLPYIVTDPPRATPYGDDHAVMLSSPDQIRYATRAFGSDQSEFVRGLLARLRASPGQFVPLSDPTKAETPPKPATPIHGPTRVAIMVDGGTVSAAEVLVLDGLASTRTVVVGEPTEGALDYQSTSIVWFSSRERRWGLGYPTITRNVSLPKNGMRGVGIRPDVRADWTTIADPIAYVDAMLRRPEKP